jgi:hypothetical protein
MIVLSHRPAAKKQPLSAVESVAARARYLASKMADLPATYSDQLVQSGDDAELAASKQIIRKQFRDDLKMFNSGSALKPGEAADLMVQRGASPPVPPSEGCPVDLSKMTGFQLIEMGLREAALK